MLEAIGAAIFAGIVQGLITWGAVRVEIRYLRRDTDRAHWRLDNLPCGTTGRRREDCPGGPG